jgi:Tol biopolymer transport system component
LSVVVVLIGVGVAFAVMATHKPDSRPTSFTPAQETSSAVSATGSAGMSAEQSASVGATATASGDSTSTTSAPSGQIVHSGKIAYRLNGQIWVAGEDGAGAKSVVASGTFVSKFSLSPDGRTLVMLQGSGGSVAHAVLVDVASKVQTQTPLAIDLPVWSPDSAWLAYTVGDSITGYSIRRVDRGGIHDSILVSRGAQPQISADGRRVAYTKSVQPSITDGLKVIDVATTDKPVGVPGTEGATRFGWAPGGSLYYARPTTPLTTGWLGIADRTLTKSSVVASLAAGSNVSPGQLFVSPDGSKVFLSMGGDDGYSRLYLADTSAKKITLLSTRRDAYPVAWLLNGSGVLYIDGNVIQKETPSLMRMTTAGTQKKTVIAGASL